MLIIWRGLGFLALILPLLLYGLLHNYGGLGVLLGGAAVLALGLSLNKQGNRHSLYGIPMQWCGLIELIIAVVMFVKRG